MIYFNLKRSFWLISSGMLLLQQQVNCRDLSLIFSDITKAESDKTGEYNAIITHRLYRRWTKVTVISPIGLWTAVLKP